MKLLLTVFLALAPTVAAQAANCFTLLDKTGSVVYRSALPPIDLSAPISAGMARAYPGMHLLWTNDLAPCQELDARAGTAREAAGRGAGSGEVALPSRLGAPIIPLRDGAPVSAQAQSPGGQGLRPGEMAPPPQAPRPRVNRGVAGRR